VSTFVNNFSTELVAFDIISPTHSNVLFIGNYIQAWF